MKTTLSLLAASAASLATAQSIAEGFTYVGCVKAEVSAFPVAVDFFTAFPAADCMTACGSFGYAALRVS